MPNGVRAALGSLSSKQRGRIVLALQLITLLLATFAAPIVDYFREQRRVFVSASSAYGPEYDAQYAVDGIPDTEWCLPDGTLGYIDLRFANTRRVDSVDITNGHNPNYFDRAIVKARILVFNGDVVVERHEFELPGIEPEHKARRIELSGQRATRLRLEVTQFAGNGAALAEIHVE